MKILIANITDDIKPISETLLSDQDFTIDIADNISIASEKAYLYEYDCILLHCNLSDRAAKDFLSEIEDGYKNSGFIVISGEDSVTSKINALNAGADDYVAIPYHPDELKARILAVVRRKKFNTRHKIHFANMIIDLGLKKVLVWDHTVSLTRKEYEILVYFIMNKNRTVSSLMLSEYLWSEESENKDANLLISHIKNLRKKLKLAKAELEIKNIYSVGYQIIEV